MSLSSAEIGQLGGSKRFLAKAGTALLALAPEVIVTAAVLSHLGWLAATIREPEPEGISIIVPPILALLVLHIAHLPLDGCLWAYWNGVIRVKARVPMLAWIALALVAAATAYWFFSRFTHLSPYWMRLIPGPVYVAGLLLLLNRDMLPARTQRAVGEQNK